jgi:undecaprenyl-diphosphatase
MLRFFLALCIALPAAAQTAPPTPLAEPTSADTSPLRFARWAYQDLGALGGEIATPRFGAYAAGATAFTLGLAWLDDDGVRQAQSLYGDEGNLYRDILTELDDAGGPPMTLLTLGLAGGALVVPNTTFQDAAFTAAQTLVYAGLTGYAMKGILGRARPEDAEPMADPYAFFETTGKNPFSSEGNSSFPSGHAISSFGIVTVWATYYPHPLTYALYLIPTGAVLNRMSIEKHWPTDIVVGAAIGVGIGRFLAVRHQRLQRGETADASRLGFRVGPGSAALTYRLGD